MIPKKIHYCWFGGKEKPKLIMKCIESWSKYCSDFEIIEWNENNFDINCCEYVKAAYAEKKWAFVSDYARHYVLFEHGGVYLDTDVELIQPLDSLLCTNFLGMESSKCDLNTGLICGCEAHCWYCEQTLNVLNNIQPILESDETTLAFTPIPVITNNIFEKLGYVRENKMQQILDFTIYPTEYFAHNTTKGHKGITQNTYSIHHYMASWQSFGYKWKNNNFKGKIVLCLGKLIGERNMKKVIDKLRRLY